MTNEVYRPWGNLSWVINKIPKGKKWTFCGCLSSEDRTLAAFDYVADKLNIETISFLEIADEDSRYKTQIQQKIDAHKNTPSGKIISQHITKFELMFKRYDEVINLFDSLALHGDMNIIIDISCMPKRFFFPLIKRMIFFKHKINNLLVTNTIPMRYATDELSESYEKWLPLPLFGEDGVDDKQVEAILLGVGHLPMGSPEPIRDLCSSSKIMLYMPFPGTASSLEPTWKFIHQIKRTIGNHEKIHITRVNARDMPEVFSYLEIDTAYGKEKSILVPCGPKPFSLAMAIFACTYSSQAYYTQPTVYHPDYSIGIAGTQEEPTISTYAIIANNSFLYEKRAK